MTTIIYRIVKFCNMLLKETLRDVVRLQRAELSFFDYGTPRESLTQVDLSLPYAHILSGVRRCGKSTAMLQLMKKLAKKCCYFRFEDTRVEGFEASDFQKLNDVLIEEYGKDCGFYFLDEIQNVPKWEVFVRSMLDAGKKFVITGSNASLLSKELGTRLTGRHLRHELFPFSFKETLSFSGKAPSAESFGKHIANGGFPEYLKYGRNDILQELLNDIIERDIVVRHGLRDSKITKEMALYLLSNAGKEFSYNGLKKTFNLGSTNTAISYVSYFEDSYLLFTVPKFDYSLKKRLINPKKVYSIDTGMSGANSVSFSSDKGRMLENAVFIELRMTSGGNNNIFYFRKERECDFLVREKEKVTMAIQVCHELHDDNKKRELDGILEALREFGLHAGLILTYDQEDEFTIDGKRIVVKPVWKWVLEKQVI